MQAMLPPFCKLLPDAIITKAYAPILVFGCVGGAVIGGCIHGWAMPA